MLGKSRQALNVEFSAVLKFTSKGCRRVAEENLVKLRSRDSREEQMNYCVGCEAGAGAGFGTGGGAGEVVFGCCASSAALV